MSQEVIEITEREIEIIEVVERGPAGPSGPQANINYTVVSSPQTLSNSQNIAADTSGGTFTLTLPASPNAGDSIDIFDYSETFDTNPLTIARNGQRIESLEENLVCNVEGAYFTMIYTGSARGWQILPRYGTSGGGGESILTNQGDTLYRGALVNERLPIGTAGQILKVNSGATAPEWGAAPATGVTSVTGTAPIASSGGATPAISISAATQSAAGSMSSADKTKLDGIAANANNYTHPNHSGDVTSAGDGATTIANDAVSNAKLANMATATIKGRATASTGDPEDLSASSVRTLLNTDQVTDARTPTSHSHGNLTNDGKVGTTANLPLKTGTNGVVEAGSFGTSAGSFCAGDDARLSDARTPSSTLAHKASHATGGTDALAPSDIGAQSIFVTEDLGTITANVTLTAARAKIYTVTVNTFDTPTPSVQLPSTGVQAGDVVQIRFTSNTGRQMPVRNGNGSFLGNSLTNGQRVTYIAASTSNDSWAEDGTNRHTHVAADITSGTLDVARLPVGTGSTQVAAGNHTHVVADVTGAAASGSITTSGLTQATARILGRTSASTGAIEEITVGSGLSLSAGELSATGGSGVTAVGPSTADVLSVSGSDLVADDPNADRIIFWDDSESKLRYLEAGSGLSISGTTMTATATGTIGGGTGSTDNSILRSDGTGGSTLQDSAFVIADNATASPNNTVNHASIQATGGSTNVSVSIVPKGTGAFMLQVPNAAAGGGNVRGAGAVDLQTTRSAATQVASGDRSFIGAGTTNTASGIESVVCGGENNLASGTEAVVCGGRNNTASNFWNWVGGGIDNSASGSQTAVVCGGANNTASGGFESFVGGGRRNTASGSGSVVCGGGDNLTSTANNTASATHSAILGGIRGLADRYAIQAHGAGNFSGNVANAQGEAQRIRAVLRCKTTTNAAVEMALDGSATYLTIPSGKVIFCNIKVVGVKSDGSAVATYERQYAAKNVAGTSSEVYAAVTIGVDNASSTSLEVATVDAGDYIRIRPTGITFETWRWVASVDAVEVAYGT